MGPAKTQPALLGGVAIGVLSALPVINLANCCCAWFLFGGALAAYLMQQNYPGRVGVGDGAIVGLLAGAAGALICAVLTIPLHAMLGPWQDSIIQRALENAGEMPPEARAWVESMRGGVMMGVTWVVGTLITLCVSSFFGMLGGILGALFFAKDGPPPPPPPTTPPPLPYNGA